MENAENKFEIEKLRIVIVEYKIPMSFDLQNCIKEGDEGKPFLVVIDNIPARISIERIYEFRYKNESFHVAPFSKMEEDRGGMLSHSKVQIWFDSQTFDSGKIDKNVIRIIPDQFIDLSIGYINEFIKKYKNITNEYWLRPIIKKDIFNVQYVLVDTIVTNGPYLHTISFLTYHIFPPLFISSSIISTYSFTRALLISRSAAIFSTGIPSSFNFLTFLNDLIYLSHASSL